MTACVRWGVLDLPLEVRDAEKRIFGVRYLGGEPTLRFVFSGEGPAQAIEADGRRLSRL